jgi:flagellar basal body-associated protein FliL
MKQKDIGLIVVVAIVSIVVATLVSGFLFNKTGARQQKAESVDPISATFAQPDTAYFNAQSVDPTQIIRIGDNSNQTPFKQTQ